MTEKTRFERARDDVRNATYGETRYWESPSAAKPVPGRLEIGN